MFRLINLSSQARPMINKTLATLLVVSAAATFSACSDNDTATTAPDAEAPVAQTPAATEAEVTSEQAVVEEAAVTEPTTEAAIETPSQESMPAEETAATAAPEVELAADAGKVLYEKQCKTCHESGLVGAPKYGNKEAWAPHIAKDKATLYEHSAKGFNKMPPQAVNGVTEAQVHAAVDYMLAGVS